MIVTGIQRQKLADLLQGETRGLGGADEFEPTDILIVIAADPVTPQRWAWGRSLRRW